MSHSNYQQSLQFNFEGQFLGFVFREGTPKYLRLIVLSEELHVKIPKALRNVVSQSLHPGEMIAVSGVSKFNRDTQKLKLKAMQITPLVASHKQATLPTSVSSVTSATDKAKVKPQIKLLVCQKSGCLKKGGKELIQELEKTLRDRNLHPYVTIQASRCLKHCSSAPNVVMMPGNRRYTKVCPKAIPKIAESIAQKLEICPY
jgi:(2Fe-2S) ferredoxin